MAEKQQSEWNRYFSLLGGFGTRDLAALNWPPQKPRKEKVSLELEVSPELAELLGKLAENSHTDQADILRRAIALYLIAVDARARGERVALVGATPEDEFTEIKLD